MKKSVISALALALLFIGAKASALTVSPARVEVSVNPGHTVGGEIELINEQNEEKLFYASTENFEARGDSGAPYFNGTRDNLAAWFRVTPEVRLAPGEKVKVPYTITVPAGAKPGGYYAGVFYGSQKPEVGAGQLAIGGRIGVIFLTTVNGDIKESAGLSSFASKSGKRFFTDLPIEFTYGFNNTGGDRVAPKGSVVVKNTLRMESAKMNANSNEGSVLPGSLRNFNLMWGASADEKSRGFFDKVKYQWNNFALGWYTAELDLSWGARGNTAHDTYHFFVFPWQLMFVAGLVVIALRFVLRAYKSHIIAEAAATKK